MADAGPTLEQIDSALAEVKSDDVRDQLRAGLSAGEDKSSPPPDTGSKAPPADGGDKGAPRDEHGRFAPKTDAAASPPADDGAKPPADGKPPAAAAPPADDNKPVAPRPEWSPEDHKKFHVLPPDAQKFVLGIAERHAKAESEARVAAARYSEVEAVLAPRRPTFAQRGRTEGQVLTQLFALSDFANRDPVGFISMIAQDRGIDLAKVAAGGARAGGNGADGGGGGNGADPLAAYKDDPVVQAVLNRMENLQSEVEKLSGSYGNRVQQEAAERDRQNRQIVVDFEQAKDESGALKHPYIGEVRGHMRQLLLGGLATSLEDAYNQASRAHPGVWSKIEAANNAKRQRDQEADSRRKAAAALTAGSSVSGLPGSTAKPAPTGDIREDLRSEFASRGML